jgi:transposase
MIETWWLAPPSKDHDCEWQAYAKTLEQKLDTVMQRLGQLEKHVIGPQSEKRKRSGKMPPPVSPTPKGKAGGPVVDRLGPLETEVIPVAVPEADRRCAACGRTDLKVVGRGKSSTVIEYVAAHFRKRVFLRETLACKCGGCIVTARAPDRVGDKTQYASSFVAHVVVTKCADNRAQYNLAKEYGRAGVPISRSTINTLFHRAAVVLQPLVARLFARIAASELVFADETSMRMQGTEKKAFIWTFIADALIGYRFSADRSGATPVQVLGDSLGVLICDAYTGYNKLLSTGNRQRGGCLAHARRKIFDASEIPEASQALDLIGAIYAVEHDAKQRGVTGGPEHADMRSSRSRVLFARLLRWAREQRGRHGPKSQLGRAARYILKNWRELGLFLRDARIPPDNNRSEAALRRVAMGRKVFLFVGHQQAGENLAGLYSLVASCELNGINPIEYLTDVLIRVDRHPASRIDELLPDAWAAR